MKNAKYIVKSLTKYESEIYENGVPSGKTGDRVYLCIEKIVAGLEGLKDQRTWGGLSLNRGVTIDQATAKLPKGMDITGSVRFEGEPEEVENADGSTSSYYKAVLV